MGEWGWSLLTEESMAARYGEDGGQADIFHKQLYSQISSSISTAAFHSMVNVVIIPIVEWNSHFTVNASANAD